MDEGQEDKPLIKLRLEFIAPDGQFFVRLQRLLDVLTVSTAGLAGVIDGPSMDFPAYWAMELAKDARLPRQVAVAEAECWHLRTVVRDAMEITSTFLEECGSVCELLSQSSQRMKLGSGYVMPDDECHQIMQGEARVFHKLNFPDKIKRLRDKFGIVSENESHVQSANKLRNCRVHRLGIVSDPDVDNNGELTIWYSALEIVSQNPDGTQEIVLGKPDAVGKSVWSIVIRWPEKSKVFRTGDRIELSGEEITYIFFSLAQFAATLVQSINEYGKRMGISIDTNLLAASGQALPGFASPTFHVI